MCVVYTIPMHILFVRHGQSTANTLQVFANRPGDQYPLTSLGQRQANDLASQIASEPMTHVYTSPLLRARQTAAIVAAARSLPLQVAAALREYDVGEFEGLPYGGPHAWRMEAYHENEGRWRQGAADHRLAGGESLDELRARTGRFLRGLIASHAPSDVILLVGHGGLFRVALPGLLANVTFEFSHMHTMDHGTIVRATLLDGRLACTQWGDWRFPASSLPAEEV
jgi:broad specificity phosphatase PhoE